MRVYTEEQKKRKLEWQKINRHTEEYREKARAYSKRYRELPGVKEKKQEANKTYFSSVAYREKQGHKFKQPQERAKLLYKSVKRRATQREISFDLDLNWFEERLLSGLCEVSKIPFRLDNYGENWNKFYSPSVDRIDNLKGYLKENCRMVLFGFNAGKHTATDIDFARLVSALVENGFCKGITNG